MEQLNLAAGDWIRIYDLRKHPSGARVHPHLHLLLDTASDDNQSWTFVSSYDELLVMFRSQYMSTTSTEFSLAYKVKLV
jgi:hypothetical protein